MKQFLDNLLSECKLDENNLDPLFIAKDLADDAALICALFAYGNVKAMIKFLRSLDFALLDENEETIKAALNHHYYRFQTIEDVQQLFIGFAKMRRERVELQTIFETAYKNGGFLYALSTLIATLHKYINANTHGLGFLLAKPFDHTNPKGVSALKRYLMFLRWMVRTGFPDLGRWRAVNSADLLIPLDTHSFTQAQKLGLIQRKTADLLASIELTNRLREFDESDPVKYDFALYRLGQNS
ncbi:TIGR02757 family protein [Campylobacterota bacterium]|nr:TIGR02757 family protein [Campylobacterota bacterium]